MTLTIGEALKRTRLQAGLTQTEMAAGLVSESFYSKVERGVHQIDADLLIQILNTHHISVINFFQYLDDNSLNSKLAALQNQMTIAANQKDIKQLERLKKELERLNAPDWLWYRYKMFNAWTRRSIEDISEEDRKHARKLLMEGSVDEMSIAAFSVNIIFLDLDDSLYFLNRAYAYIKGKKMDDLLTIDNLYTSTVNYLNICVHRHADKSYAEPAIKYLKNAPTYPEFMYCFIMAEYYEAWFNDDKEKIDAIVKVLKMTGQISYIQDTLK